MNSLKDVLDCFHNRWHIYILIKECREQPIDKEDQMNSNKEGGGLEALQPSSSLHKDIEAKFIQQWIKPNTTDLKVEKIFQVWPSQSAIAAFKEYEEQLKGNNVNTKVTELYHGTVANCNLLQSALSSATVVSICQIVDCSICGIIKHSFDPSRIGINQRQENWQRFGTGFYFHQPHQNVTITVTQEVSYKIYISPRETSHKRHGKTP